MTGERRRVIAAGTAREFGAGAPEARVTSEGNAGWHLLGRRRSGRPTLSSSSSSGRSGEGRAVLLFGDPWSADAFRAMEGPGK